MKAKTIFLLLFNLFLNEKVPEPVKKSTVPGAGAGQKRTGSATLVMLVTRTLSRYKKTRFFSNNLKTSSLSLV